MFGLFNTSTDANSPQSLESIKVRRALARKLLESGTSTAPVDHWLQGAARLGQAFHGAVENHYADRADAAGEAATAKKRSALMDTIMGGPETPAATPAVTAPKPSLMEGALIPGIDDRYTPEEARAELAQWADAGNVDLSGLNDRFAIRKAAFLEDNPHEADVSITSAYRSPEKQAAMYADRHNNPYPVAPPGRSRHNHGEAGDVSFGSDQARAWMHSNAGRYGLAFPHANDPIHLELAKGPVKVAAAGGSGDFLAARQKGRDEAPAAQPVAPAQIAQAGNANLKGRMKAAYDILSDPRANEGDKAYARMVIERAMKQDDPRDGMIKDLTIAEKRKALNAVELDRVQGPDGQVYERRKGSAEAWRPTIKLSPGTFRPATAEEKKAAGYEPEDVVQVGPDGRFHADRAKGKDIEGEVEARRKAADKQGLKPGTPAYDAYALTGKMPKEDQQPLSAGDKKAIMQAEDAMPDLDAQSDAIRRAIELNRQTFQGAGAGARAWAGTALPDWMVPDFIADPKGAAATREFGQLTSMEAIKSMSSTLKGATTDREMGQFQEILANPSTPPEIRERTLGRMLTLVERQRKINQDRITEMRGGDYYKPADKKPQSQPAQQPAAPAGDGWKEIAPGVRIREKR